MRIHKFNDYNKINEAAPRLPKSEDYWIKKGKTGKDVMIYTHDDMDGIFSAIVVKKYLKNAGFNIKGYGVLNYMDGWKNTSLEPKMINVVVDFASMPDKEREDLIDFYVDHHGMYSEEEKEHFKDKPVLKTKTDSAYEGICVQLGYTLNSEILDAIDMIDSAKYTHYKIDWRQLLDFSWDSFKKSENPKLAFAAAFNQFLKRSDHKTIIEVIDNVDDVSIYAIYNAMKKLYPGNNKNFRTGEPKEMTPDAEWRLSTMASRTRGRSSEKTIYKTGEDFINSNTSNGQIRLDGYQLIGDVAFVPSGTWANALRIRSIILQDYDSGVIPKEHEVKFTILQYGNTIQVAAFGNIKDMKNKPVLRNGKEVSDLGSYMTGLLKNFQEHLGYYEPDTSVGQEEITVSGGHGGIGTISNIIGTCDVEPYKGHRFLDLFKNKIISDLGGVKLPMKLKWVEPRENTTREPEMDAKVMKKSDIRKINKFGEILEPVGENFDYHVVSSDGSEYQISRDEFLEIGLENGMNPNDINIDMDNKKVVGTFSDYLHKNN
tara:strand:+ start:40 stop:1668 length:1629 start_codon:yes stop_codon:yes gene_type:complete